MKSLQKMAGSILTIGALTALVACGSKEKEATSGTEEQTITFVHHKIDWEPMAEMIQKFNEKYPNIKVKSEPLSDYNTSMGVRMNGKNYGDVAVLPSNENPEEFQNFFEPLGEEKELSEKYLSMQDYSFDGTSYGIPMAEHFDGMLYNKKVFKDAGITSLPRTPEEFIQAMKAIKEKTDAIPVYTNYAAGWPLSNWDDARFMVSADENINNEMLTDKAPFAKGKPLYDSYKLLYDLAKEKLIEKDPVTSDWDESRQGAADGKIGVIFLGSWLIEEVKNSSKTPEDIGYMAYPQEKDGKLHAYMTSDYNLGINVHSKHKEAARIFIDWFTTEGNYTSYTGQVPAAKDGKWPEELQKMVDDGVEPVYKAVVPKDKEGMLQKINSISEVGIGLPETKRKIIEAGIGTSKESFDTIMDHLNKQWAKGIQEAN